MGSGGINKNNNDLRDVEAARLRARTAGRKADDEQQDVKSVGAKTPAPSRINLLDRLRDREIGRGGPNWRRRVLRERYGTDGCEAAEAVRREYDNAHLAERYGKRIDDLIEKFNNEHPQLKETFDKYFVSRNTKDTKGVDVNIKILKGLYRYEKQFQALWKYSGPVSICDYFSEFVDMEGTLLVLEALLKEGPGKDDEEFECRLRSLQDSIGATLVGRSMLEAGTADRLDAAATSKPRADMNEVNVKYYKLYRRVVTPILLELCKSQDIERACKKLENARKIMLNEIRSWRKESTKIVVLSKKDIDEIAEMNIILNNLTYDEKVENKNNENSSFRSQELKQKYMEKFLSCLIYCRIMNGIEPAYELAGAVNSIMLQDAPAPDDSGNAGNPKAD